MTTKKQQKIEMYVRIEKHGLKLLELFPNCKTKDPIKLCKELRVYERKITRLTTALCNGRWGQDRSGRGFTESEIEAIENQIDRLGSSVIKKLGLVECAKYSFFVNYDPRGYALKLKTGFGDLYSDLGSNGILAPDLTEN